MASPRWSSSTRRGTWPARDLAWINITGVTQRGCFRVRDAGPGRPIVTFRLAYHSDGGLLGLIADDHEAEREFLDWLTGDTDVRAGELAEAMIARAGRR